MGEIPPALNSPDIVYGVAVSDDEHFAEELARVSLSNEIGARVTNEKRLKTSERNGQVSEDYFEDIKVSSSMLIRGAKKIIKRLDDGRYKVYQYINKKAYVSERIDAYNKFVGEVKEYAKTEGPHKVNLILGSMYNAYASVNDTLLNFLYPKSINFKETLERDIKVLYDRAKTVRIWDGGQHGVMAYEMNHHPLPGFEYQNSNGEWVSPIVFKTADTQEVTNDDSKKRWACIDGIVGKTYHILYEELVDGKYMKIPVPDLFYF